MPDQIKQVARTGAQNKTSINQSINQTINQFICQRNSHKHDCNKVHQIYKTYKAHKGHLQ